MSVTTEPELEQQTEADVGPELDTHEAVWAEIQLEIDARVAQYICRLGTVTALDGGKVRVAFDNEVGGRQVGFAHTLGVRYMVNQRVMVQPVMGGEFVVAGAITSLVGPHERVIGEADMMSNAIATHAIIDGAVTTGKIAANQVDRSRLAHPAVARENIFPGEVLGHHIAGGQISGVHIQGDAISTGHIGADQVTRNKIAQNAVGGVQLDGNTVDTNHLKDKAVTKAKLADNAIPKEPDLSAYVKSDQLAPGATGSDRLATRQWVQDNFKKKGSE